MNQHRKDLNTRTALRRQLLIVDDHRELRESMTNWIKLLYPDLDFIQAGTGEEAVELARTHQPDIILMDLDLPGINGLTAMEQIRELGIDSRFVMITIHNDEFYREKALNAGAAAFVSKQDIGKMLPLALQPMIEGVNRE